MVGVGAVRDILSLQVLEVNQPGNSVSLSIALLQLCVSIEYIESDSKLLYKTIASLWSKLQKELHYVLMSM